MKLAVETPLNGYHFFGQTFHWSKSVMYTTVTRGEFHRTVSRDFRPYVYRVQRWCEECGLPVLLPDATLSYFNVLHLSRLLDVFDSER